MQAINQSTSDHYPEFTLSEVDFSKQQSISQKTIENIIKTFNHRHILIIRNQNINEDQLINTAKIFGEPTPALVPTWRLEKHPLITRHTNKKDQNNVALGVMAPEYIFHADSYFTPNPSKATLFYSLKAPKIGGETHFINMCSVYEQLSEEIKSLIEDKKVFYKNAYINQPPVSHPMVRIHPITGKKALFINKHRALGIDGIDRDDAMRLIDALYDFATSPNFIYKHKWENGDLLIWNNITTMHSATSTPESEERLLYRILTKGDLPVK